MDIIVDKNNTSWYFKATDWFITSGSIICLLLYKYTNQRCYAILSIIFMQIRYNEKLYHFKDVLNHPNTSDLFWGTLVLSMASYFNMIILMRIMKKYIVLFTTLNTIILFGGILYRFQPVDREFKLNLAMLFQFFIIGIGWNIFGMSTMLSINRLDTKQYTKVFETLSKTKQKM